MFTRNFSQDAIKALKEELLFKDHLLRDIVEGQCRGRQKNRNFVFPAVRDERMDFYWNGGKLFSYKPPSGRQKSKFVTHHKFASVLLDNSKTKDGKTKNYISEITLQNRKIRLIENFCEGYDRIKENCRRYSGLEALGVSSLYERFSCARKERASFVVVLDIEASFAKDGSMEKDRIDIVALDTENKTIRFAEAKHYSNRASLRTSSEKSDVVDQMQGYAEQIRNNRDVILQAYQAHVHVMNALFSASIPEPADVDTDPVLLIFGFDNEQQDYYLKDKIEKPLQVDHKLRVYSIGDIKQCELSEVFRK